MRMPFTTESRDKLHRRNALNIKYLRWPAGQAPLERIPTESLENIFLSSRNLKLVVTSKTIYRKLACPANPWVLKEFFEPVPRNCKIVVAFIIVLIRRYLNSLTII